LGLQGCSEQGGEPRAREQGQCPHLQSPLHGQPCPDALWVGLRYVVAIARHPVASDLQQCVPSKLANSTLALKIHTHTHTHAHAHTHTHAHTQFSISYSP